MPKEMPRELEIYHRGVVMRCGPRLGLSIVAQAEYLNQLTGYFNKAHDPATPLIAPMYPLDDVQFDQFLTFRTGKRAKNSA
jgi:hypothetical protein